MSNLIIIDRRGDNASSFNALRRHPTIEEVVNLFKIDVETTRGEMAVPAGEWYWKLVGFSLNEGPVVYRAEARDGDNNSLPGTRIVRHWPGAPGLPADVSRLYHDRGVIGVTEYGGDKFGAVEFQYTRDSVTGPGGGPDSFWVVSPTPSGKYFSDMAYNLGWLGGTNHLNPSPIFKLTRKGDEEPEAELPPEQPPADDRLKQLVHDLRAWQVDRAVQMLEQEQSLESILRRYE